MIMAVHERAAAARRPQHGGRGRVTLGGVLGALFAHSHAYPGRFTVHLVPFASALALIAAASMTVGGRRPVAAK
jgi:hypothetical protein